MKSILIYISIFLLSTSGISQIEVIDLSYGHELQLGSNYKKEGFKWPWKDGSWYENLIHPLLNSRLLIELGSINNNNTINSVVLGIAHTSYGLTTVNGYNTRNRVLGIGIPIEYKFSIIYDWDIAFRSSFSVGYQINFNYYYRGIEYKTTGDLTNYGFLKDEINQFSNIFFLKSNFGPIGSENSNGLYFKVSYVPHGILNRKFTSNNNAIIRPFENSPESVLLFALGFGL